MKQELKLCPFCGGKSFAARDWNHQPIARCSTCNVHMPATVWNQRAPDDRVQLLAKAFQSMVEHAKANFRDTESCWVKQAEAALAEAGINQEKVG